MTVMINTKLLQALCYPSEDSCEIYQDTSGIIFLGTPHNGSPVSGLAAILALSTRLLGSDTSLLLSLRSNGIQLSDLSKRFTRRLDERNAQERRMKVISICEMKPTYILQCLSVGLVRISLFTPAIPSLKTSRLFHGTQQPSPLERLLKS